MEVAGTPAGDVITDRFVPTADLMAQVLGLLGYHYAVIAHPFANNRSEELTAKASDALRQSIELLTRR